MKKKDFIYYASAALLLAVSVQSAYADEQESAVQPIQVKAEQAQDTVAKTASGDSETLKQPMKRQLKKTQLKIQPFKLKMKPLSDVMRRLKRLMKQH